MKIGIQPLLPTGNYLNKRYSIEQDFPDDSHPADNFKYLHELVIAIHMSEYPLLYKDGKPLYSNFSSYKGEDEPVIQKRNEVPDELKEYADAINSAETVEELKEKYWLRSKTNLTLLEVYGNRKKQLEDAGAKK